MADGVSVPDRLRVSVVVPALNAAATIGDQLLALSRQERVIPFEVIVADNGSTDGTPGVVAQYAAHLPRLRCIDASDSKGAAAARNAGAQLAVGEILAFCDADDVVDERWLAELRDGLAHADFVGGALDMKRLNDPDALKWRPAAGVRTEGSVFLPHAPSGNFAVWRKVFIAVGMFDESFGRGEDNEISYRLQLHGYTYEHLSNAVVHYRLRHGLHDVWRQGFDSGLADVRLYGRFRQFGFPRRSAADVLRSLLWLVVKVPSLTRRSEIGLWLRKAGLQLGRCVGSASYRVLYL